jgi:hypothetical protein
MKWVLRSAALLTVAALILGVYSFREFSANTANEYLTAGITRSAIKFVCENPGQWPKSWKDLESEVNLDGQVHFNFYLTSEQILKDRRLLDKAIEPRIRKWYTYPHHARNMDELFEVLEEAQSKRQPSMQPTP